MACTSVLSAQSKGNFGGTGVLSPPRLQVITRAKLAKVYFGLDVVVGKGADVFYSKVYPNSAPAKKIEKHQLLLPVPFRSISFLTVPGFPASHC